LATAKAQTAQSIIAVEDAQREVERKRPLVDRQIVSGGDWDRAVSGLKSAKSQLSGTQAEESSATSALSSQEAAVRTAVAQRATNIAQVKQKEAIVRQAEIDVERTFIRAPVTGTVVNRAVNIGQTVAASLQAPVIFTIAQDLSVMEIQASIIEAEVGRFSPGQAVTFTVDAYRGRTFSGEVKQIRKAPQVVQNVVTYFVIISAANRDEVLLPGMTANVTVVTEVKQAVLKVPNGALRYTPPDRPIDTLRKRGRGQAEVAEDGPGVPGRVLVVDADGEPVVVPVRLGDSDGRVTEILAGEVTEGQQVIVGTMPRENDTSRFWQMRLM
jgi:HlyD family secretion protein